MSNDQGEYPQNPGQQPPAYPGAPVPPQQPPAYPGAAAAPQAPVPPAPAYPGAAPAAPQQPAPQQPVPPQGAPGAYPGGAPGAPGYPGAGPASPPYGQPGSPAYGQPYAASRKPNGLAIAAMICGIVSVVLCMLYIIVIPLAAGVAGVVMGHISLKKIKRDPQLGGRALALTGLITGYAGIVLNVILWIVFIAAITYGFSRVGGSTY